MQSETLVFSYRQETVLSRRRAIERVILAMRERLGENLSLQEMADIALISPFHFNRVFRQVTGIPPVQFLGALRLEAAKRFLLTTQKKVIDVCFEVGYNSLGTFTRRFTELVGLSPCRLRRLAANFPTSYIRTFHEYMYKSDLLRLSHLNSGISGCVDAPDHFTGMIFVGLFSTPIPQGKPVGCALLAMPDTYRIAPVPDGAYYVFAAAFDWSADPLSYLLHEKALRGVSGSGPILVRNGRASNRADVILHAAQLTDPPILVTLPLLLTERLARANAATA